MFSFYLTLPNEKNETAEFLLFQNNVNSILVFSQTFLSCHLNSFRSDNTNVPQFVFDRFEKSWKKKKKVQVFEINKEKM